MLYDSMRIKILKYEQTTYFLDLHTQQNKNN